MIAVFIPLSLRAAVSSEYYGENKVIQKPNIPSEPRVVKNRICSCVLYAQQQGLALKGYGYAKNYPINSNTPQLSGFVVTYESWMGHIAHYYLSGEYLVLDENNYVGCTTTYGRRLKIDSPLIKGYIK